MASKKDSTGTTASNTDYGEKPKCSICGSPDVVAKIEGKYYCFRCGSKIVLEHSTKIVREYVEKYITE
jgi:DNA-directed RNA polymerase subunit RPC12/RpoP